MAKNESPAYAGMTKEQLIAEVESAGSAKQLDTIWKELEAVGYSRDGLLFGSILERKAALGVELSEEEQAQVKLAMLRRKSAEALPPVRGRMKRS